MHINWQPAPKVAVKDCSCFTGPNAVGGGVAGVGGAMGSNAMDEKEDLGVGLCEGMDGGGSRGSCLTLRALRKEMIFTSTSIATVAFARATVESVESRAVLLRFALASIPVLVAAFFFFARFPISRPRLIREAQRVGHFGGG